MSTKTFNNTVVNGGYFAAAGISAITITSTAAINGAGSGGAGLTSVFGATIDNAGRISGGVGGAGTTGVYFGGTGGAGGAGVELGSGAYIGNSGGQIVGGVGGAGGYGQTYGGSGGAGGAGIYMDTNGNLFLSGGTVTGGVGSGGGQGGGAAGYGGGGRGGDGGAGVDLAAGGYLQLLGGTITGGAGGNVGPGYFYGSGGGSGGAGIVLAVGGTVVNLGVVSGGASGVGKSGGTLPNGDGIDLFTGGLVNNDSVGTITGYDGVRDIGDGGVTLTNAGGISGVDDAVLFKASTDRLIIESGGSFTGAVLGGGGTLELAAGTGTTGGLGGEFTGFATYDVDAGGSWTLTGPNTLAGGDRFNVYGTLSVTGPLTNSGEIAITGGGGLDYAGLILSGNQTLSGAGTVSLNATGFIAGLAVGDSLTNLDNTIVGAGIIKGPLALINESAGVIDANAGTMGINLGDTLINDGLIESAGAGTLFVRFTTIDSSGGGSIVDGKTLVLDTSTLEGGSLTLDAGATLRAGNGAGLVNLGAATVSNAGVIEGAFGGLTIEGAVANNHVIESFNGDLTITGAVTGTGTARLFGSGALEVDGAFSQRVTFAAGSTSTLVLGDTAGFTGAILGLSKAGANHIDLKDVAFDPDAVATYKANKQNPASGGTLTVADGATVFATLHLTGTDYSGSTFTLSNDGGGTLITDPPKVSALASVMAGFGSGGCGSTSGLTETSNPPQIRLAALAYTG